MTLSLRSAYQSIPKFDMGVLIDSQDGAIDGIHARVTMLSPGEACLMCRGRRSGTRRSRRTLPAPQGGVRARARWNRAGRARVHHIAAATNVCPLLGSGSV